MCEHAMGAPVGRQSKPRIEKADDAKGWHRPDRGLFSPEAFSCSFKFCPNTIRCCRDINDLLVCIKDRVAYDGRNRDA